MKGAKVFATLLSFLTSAVQDFPDTRRGKNIRYSMQDIVRSTFAVFFVQSPSFLARQKLMQQARGMNNGKTLFGITRLPSDNEVRNLLDPVDAKFLRPAFASVFEYLQQHSVVDRFRSFSRTLLVALDGTGYFSSEAIHCQSCSVRHHHDGRTTYGHSALMPALVKPDCPQIIPLEPEFIVAQDGHNKQDCEIAAAKRWLTSIAPRYSALGVTILADDLYAHQPFIEEATNRGLHYILTAKRPSHKYLYEEISSMEQLHEVKHLSERNRVGKEYHTFTYRYINDLPLSGSPQSINVNWVELAITNEARKGVFHTSLITSHLITDENVAGLVQAGRCRWKIENEDFNTLKSKGYHFEHNFGHGKLNLSMTLLSLNILAFLFHTVLELLDERCTEVRKRLPRRDTFFQHIAALTEYLCFADWPALLAFMLRALEHGPAP